MLNPQVIDKEKDATITAASSRNSNLIFRIIVPSCTWNPVFGYSSRCGAFIDFQRVAIHIVQICPYLVRKLIPMASVTFKAVCIASNRRKDGTYPVRIRVTYKGVSRRLPTNLVARPKDLTRTLHIKSADITSKASALIAQMQATLSDLSPFALDGWDVDRVVAHIRKSLEGESFRLDFFRYADKYLERKGAETRRSYETALNSLAAHLGERRLDVNDITKRLLVEWRDAVDARKKVTYSKGKRWETDKEQKGGQSSRMLAKLAHIFNAAKKEYNDDDRTLIPRSPFDGVPRPTPPSEGARALTVEEMQRIVDAESSGNERVALDAFILSFCLMGPNLADMWAAKQVSGTWRYYRQKTTHRRADRAEMRVEIPAEVEPALERLKKGGGDWWLPELHRIATTKNICTSKVNACLKAWAEKNGMNTEKLSFGSARKSWATIARKIGVEKALVDECLTHVGDFPVTDIYAARDFDRMNEANRKVIACLHFRG